jgi:FemAB-related protein (PEP-CTERM system-associated)
MKIVRCDASHRDAWNAFLNRSASASLYHRFEWRDISEQCFGHETCYLAAIEAGEISGVFPIVRVKSLLFGDIACSLPFVNYGGPCAFTEQAENALLHEAERVADDWGVDYLEIRSKKHLGPRFPTAEHKVSMTVELDPDPDVLWARFKTDHRKDIRRGYKNGLTAKIGGLELLDHFYAILSESWRDLGTPIYRKSYLAEIIRTFPEAMRVCVVYAGSDPAAASLDGTHRGTVEGMWLGARAKYRARDAGYVLYWEIIKDACQRGHMRFHLGRSTVQSGGEAFKKKWNATATQLYWQYVLRTRKDIPQLNVQNPRYRLAASAWRKLPLPVTQVVGPFIARSIP